MFGGAGLYRDGVMFGLVGDGEIYLKSDAETEARFRAAGCHPFVYDREGKSVSMSYWSLPTDALDDADALRLWADIAFAAALRTKKPANKPRRRR